MRLQVESEVVVFGLGLTRQRWPTARAADRSTHSAWPAVGNGQLAIGKEEWPRARSRYLCYAKMLCPRWPKMVPRWCRVAPRCAKRRQDGPKWRQDGQNGGKMSQNGAKWAQNRAKMAQNDAKVAQNDAKGTQIVIFV